MLVYGWWRGRQGLGAAVEGELGGGAAGQGGQCQVGGEVKAVARGGDLGEVVGVPEEPGGPAGEEQRADLGDAGTVAKKRQVPLRGEVEGGSLAAGQVGSDDGGDVAPLVLS